MLQSAAGQYSLAASWQKPVLVLHALPYRHIPFELSSMLQMEKVLQLHLACNQRLGVIIVGPSGSGKSTLWRLVRAALTRLGRAPVVHVMNPKAVSRSHLLGAHLQLCPLPGACVGIAMPEQSVLLQSAPAMRKCLQVAISLQQSIL